MDGLQRRQLQPAAFRHIFLEVDARPICQPIPAFVLRARWALAAATFAVQLLGGSHHLAAHAALVRLWCASRPSSSSPTDNPVTVIENQGRAVAVGSDLRALKL